MSNDNNYKYGPLSIVSITATQYCFLLSNALKIKINLFLNVLSLAPLGTAMKTHTMLSNALNDHMT